MQETLDKPPLEDQEGDKERRDDHQRCCCQERPLRANFSQLGKAYQPGCQRAAFVAVGDDQRPEEFIPVPGYR